MKNTNNKCETVPVWHKTTITVNEATEYSNIGRDKLYQLVKRPDCNFALKLGNKILIKRAQFEKFIAKAITI